VRFPHTFAAIYRFELRQHLRSAVFWLAAVAFFLLSFGAVASDAVTIGGAVGNVNRNAPFVITQILAVMSVIGVFVTTAFVAGAVLRDYELQAHELFFSTPVTKGAYLGGRFLGALSAALLIFVAVALAILMGGMMPWLDPERVGPILPGAYVSAFALFVIPNVLLMSAIFFGLATLTRSMMGTYIGVVAFFAAYAIAGTILGDLENRQLGALLDPFGFAAFGLETRYWTTAERNARIATAAGTLLWNRLLWLGVATAVLAATFARFRFVIAETRRARKRRRTLAPVQAAEAPRSRELTPPRVPTAHGARAARSQWLHVARLEIRRVVRSLPFLIILAFGVFNLIGSSTVLDQLFGTPVHPVTHLMLQMIQGGFLLFVIIITTLYAGELVWRERQVGLSDVTDALPVPLWVLWSAKLTALFVVVAIVLLVGGATAIVMQLWQGYTDLELPLYAKGLFLEIGVPFAQLAVLALVAQVLTNQRFVGYLVMILYFISIPVLGALDFDHNLYRYASSPAAPYSDMNGYGPYVKPLFWFNLYWTFAAAALVIVVHLFWVRGRETAWRTRQSLARQRFRGPARVALAAALAGFVATGGWIFYNTNVLNEYVTDEERQDRLARYEREYGQYEGLPQPRIAGVYAEVDIYPERRDAAIRGRYRLVNRRAVTIDRLHVLLPSEARLERLEGVGPLEHHDSVLGYRIYQLPAPLAPGDSMTLAFDVAVETRGFRNGGELTSLVANGSFFNNFEFFPHIGYTSSLVLQDPNERRKRALPPVVRMPKLGTDSARRDNYISSQSDWIDFETIVSTSPDQVALAPGYLQREWTENGRRYFHYRMDAPILGFFSYLSADWAVAKDRWRDVSIEVYYDPAHPYNVPRMIDAVKKSLDYFTTHFSPYQHRQVRIVEFPRYARFAQSFPNTIPFSESIGFIARLDDDEAEAIDYVFYVTAHEVAHQWWAHQVIGAEMQGATVMSETMAQYSALMVMEQEYGPELMRRFLKYELDRYLAGRGGERIEELPLLRVENQAYIHYAKGSLVMYRLRDLFGEAPLNGVLADYIRRTAFTGPPYTTSAEFLDAIRAATPPGAERVLEDLFETITLWDVRARTASWSARDDGRYDVVLEYEARKLRASGAGEETEVPFDDLVEVGVFGARTDERLPHGAPLLVEQRRLTGPSGRINLVVDAEPQRAGIDPYNKLIDRNPEDNVVAAGGG
jgi:ABC-type transport system involved in multi-copper enzyme maturation permease subunit